MLWLVFIDPEWLIEPDGVLLPPVGVDGAAELMLPDDIEVRPPMDPPPIEPPPPPTK